MSLLDNNLEIRQTDGYVGNFQNVNPNYHPTNQTSYSDNFHIQNLLQAEETKQNIPNTSPTSSGKCLINYNSFYPCKLWYFSRC